MLALLANPPITARFPSFCVLCRTRILCGEEIVEHAHGEGKSWVHVDCFESEGGHVAPSVDPRGGE